MIKLGIIFMMMTTVNAQVNLWNYKPSDVKAIEADVEKGDISADISTNAVVVELDEYYDADKCDISVEKFDNTLKVRIKSKKKWFYFSSKNECKAGLKIKAPADKKLFFKVGSGNIEIGRFSNIIRLGLGAGDVHLNGVRGDISINNGSGNINGDIASENLKIKSGKGNAYLSWVSTPKKGSIVISGSAFNADFSFPDKTKMNVSYSGNGKFKSEFDSNSTSNFNIDFKVGAGDLNIRRLKK